MAQQQSWSSLLSLGILGQREVTSQEQEAAMEKEQLLQLLRTPIKWAADFDVHVPCIDAQHKKLFVIAEQLRLTLVAAKAEEGPISGEHLKRVKVVVQWLVQYCIVHFEAEEGVQKRVGFPERPGHLKVHKEFFEQCRMYYEIVSRILGQGGELDIVPVYALVMRWLVNHICGSDQKIGEWCVKQQLDMAREDLQDMTDSVLAIPEGALPDLTPTVA